MRNHICALCLASLACCPSVTDAAVRKVAITGQPAPGTLAGTVFHDFSGAPAINALGQTVFNASIEGAATNSENNLGIWSEGNGALSLVARKDDYAPGTPAGTRFESFFLPNINAVGQTTFSGSLKAANDSDTGIWSSAGSTLQLIAREGDQAPGAAPGANFGNFSSPEFNDLGHAGFGARLQVGSGGVTTNNDAGIWTNVGGSLAPLAREGSQAPGTPPGAVFSGWDNFLHFPSLSPTGGTAFRGSLLSGPGGVTSANNSGIWSNVSGSMQIVAREGSQAHALPPGVNYGDFGFSIPGINAAGQLSFFASLQAGGVVTAANDSAIWSQLHGPLALVAREGDHAPGTPAGAVFGNLANSVHWPVLNANGNVAFVGVLQTGTGGVVSSNDTGIWSDAGSMLELVAREGSQAPGVPTGGRFFNMSGGLPVSVVLNASGQTAFFGRLQHGDGGVDGNNDRGIWAQDVTGTLRLIARTGDSLEVAPGDFRTISHLFFTSDTGNEDGRPSGFNDLGELVFRAAFTDGSAGIFVSNLVAVPEPNAAVAGLLAAGCAVAFARRARASLDSQNGRCHSAN